MFAELDREFNKDKYRPSDIETIFYFLSEQGISLEKLEHLPIPYIMGLINTKSYYTEQSNQGNK
jgi:hypothetical protein